MILAIAVLLISIAAPLTGAEAAATPSAAKTRGAEASTPSQKVALEPPGAQIQREGTTPDQYENNDDFSTATLLGSAPTGEPQDFTVSVNATLHRHTGWDGGTTGVDEDYFKFNLYGNATLTVTLSNIPLGKNYDLDVKRALNVLNNGPDQFESFTIFKNYDNSPESYYSVSAVAGTYFAKVYSPDNQQYTDTQYYTLTVNVVYNRASASIADLRFNKGCGAAFWKSDFDPAGITPYSSLKNRQIGYYSTDYSNIFSPVVTDDSPVDMVKQIMNVANGARILHSSCFLWGRSERSVIATHLRTIRNALIDRVEEYQTARIQLALYTSLINGASFVTGGCLSVVLPEPAGTIVSIAFDVSTSLVITFLLPLLFPAAADAVSVDLLAYVNTLIAAVETNENSSDAEVVRIDSTYSLSYTGSLLNVYNIYCANFTPQVTQASYLYSPDAIPSYFEGAHCLGRTYMLKTPQNFLDAMEGEYVSSLDDVNTAEVLPLCVNEPAYASAGLMNGQYAWFSFTPDDNAYYRFYTLGSGTYEIEAFPSVVAGRSVANKHPDTCSLYDGHNAELTDQSYLNHNVYLRVHGPSWGPESGFTMLVQKMATFHVHDFSNCYAFVSDACHAAYCACGQSEQQPHAIASGSIYFSNRHQHGYCSLCQHDIDLTLGGGGFLENTRRLTRVLQA